MSVESGSTRNTLGSQLSTTSSASHSSGSGSSKGTPSRKKEYWKKDRKFIRILTVIAYIASVSMAAVLLSTYYVFIWTSDVDLNANSTKQISNQRQRPRQGRVNVVTLPYPNEGEEDEFQRIPSNEQQPYSRGGRKRLKQAHRYNNMYYKPHPKPEEDEEYGQGGDEDQLSSGEQTDPIALPLVQQNPLSFLSAAVVAAVNEGRKQNENDTSTSTSRPTTNSVDKPYANSDYDEDESQYVAMNSNTTRPYRQRQIPTPSAPIPITKTMPAFVLEPTTTEVASTTQLSDSGSSSSDSGASASSAIPITTTQPMISLLWNASKLIQQAKN